MNAINPDRARDLGPALGLKLSRKYVIKAFPMKYQNADIHHKLAAPIDDWPGWVVQVLQRRRDPRAPDRCLLVVGASTEPPTDHIACDGNICVVERYRDPDANDFLPYIPHKRVADVPDQADADDDGYDHEAEVDMSAILEEIWASLATMAFVDVSQLAPDTRAVRSLFSLDAVDGFQYCWRRATRSLRECPV